MSYYEHGPDKSIGLKPIVLGVGLVTLLGFGVMYFTAGHALTNDGSAITGENAAPSASAPAAEVQTGKKPLASHSHTHA